MADIFSRKTSEAKAKPYQLSFTSGVSAGYLLKNTLSPANSSKITFYQPKPKQRKSSTKLVDVKDSLSESRAKLKTAHGKSIEKLVRRVDNSNVVIYKMLHDEKQHRLKPASPHNLNILEGEVSEANGPKKKLPRVIHLHQAKPDASFLSPHETPTGSTGRGRNVSKAISSMMQRKEYEITKIQREVEEQIQKYEELAEANRVEAGQRLVIYNRFFGDPLFQGESEYRRPDLVKNDGLPSQGLLIMKGFVPKEMTPVNAYLSPATQGSTYGRRASGFQAALDMHLLKNLDDELTSPKNNKQETKEETSQLLQINEEIIECEKQRLKFIEMKSIFSPREDSPLSKELFRLVKEGNASKLQKFLFQHRAMIGRVIDARDATQETAMHWAAKRGRKDIVELLFVFGATLDLKDLGGRTPADLADMIKADKVEEFIGVLRDLTKRYPHISRTQLMDKLYGEKNPYVLW